MPVDYAAIAAKHITRPATTKRLPKWLVYGRSKKGKTTFGISAGIEKTLVLDPEDGTDEMKKKNPHRWKIGRWEDVEEACNFVRFGTHQYEWVVVDGLTRFNNMAIKYVMRLEEEKSLTRIPGFVQKQDYGKAGELMKDFMGRFHVMPIGVVYTAQERQVEGGDWDEDADIEEASAMYVPDLPKGVKSHAVGLVDGIGRIYTVKIQPEDLDKPAVTERRLWLATSEKYDTGFRSDYDLPDMLRRPTIPRLLRLVRTGSEALPATTKK